MLERKGVLEGVVAQGYAARARCNCCYKARADIDTGHWYWPGSMPRARLKR